MKSRFGIRFLQISGERLSADESEIPDFILKLDGKIKEVDLTPDKVYNADKTGSIGDSVAFNHIRGNEESSAPWRKLRKEYLTLMLCTNS